MLRSFLNNRYRSFGYAFNGFRFLWKEDHFKLHLLALVLVISMAVYFQISSIEWLFVVLASALVLISEAVNTAIEKTLDFIKMEQDKKIGAIKDMSAAFVLLSAFSAVIVGAIIFIPKIESLF